MIVNRLFCTPNLMTANKWAENCAPNKISCTVHGYIVAKSCEINTIQPLSHDLIITLRRRNGNKNR